jgi:hypothetical protein
MKFAEAKHTTNERTLLEQASIKMKQRQLSTDKTNYCASDKY